MSFTSPVFLSIIFPLLVGGCYAWPTGKGRNAFLIVASLAFYVWIEPVSFFVLIALTIANHIFAYFAPTRRKMMVALAVIVDIGVLAIYKFNGFFAEQTGGMLPRFALAAGMSFYVFQLISYVVDVADGKILRGSFVDLLFFVSFIPKIPCGPIMRFSEFRECLGSRRFSGENFASGMRLFAIGLAKKVLIADSMAPIVNPIFETPVALIPCAYCWLGAFAYLVQIYFDFSGYSDMAIGMARMFNFRFPDNFDFPYSSKSVQEFWRRWHMSLSFWFRDYLYIPLGGGRKGTARACINTMIVFLLCGIWHGSSWSFVLWGFCHGAILLIERIGFKKILAKIPGVFANLYVIAFALFSWVIFRSPSVGYALGFMRNMIRGNPSCHLCDFSKAIWFIDYSGPVLLVAGIAMSYPAVCHTLARIDKRTHGMLLAIVAILAYVFAMTGSVNPGIYENF